MTSLVFLNQIVWSELTKVQERATLHAEVAAGLAEEALAGAADARRALARAPGLASYFEALVGHAPDLLYVRLESEGELLRSWPPDLESGAAPRSISRLIDAGPLDRLLLLLHEQPIFEHEAPLVRGSERLATLHVGVDSLLIHERLRRARSQALYTVPLALGLSWLAALFVSTVSRSRIQRLGRQIERIREGDFSPIPGFEESEFSALSESLSALGRDLYSDRLKALSQKRNLEQTMDHLRDGILVLDADREVRFYNRALAPVFGQPLEKVAGEEIDELLGPDHPLRRALERLERSGQDVENFYTSLAGPDGRFREALIAAHAIHREDEIDGFVLLLEDLAGIRTLHDLVRYASRVSEMTELTAGVIHDVRNPLNAMQLHVYLLRESLSDDDPEVSRSLDGLSAAISNLDSLVRSLLDHLRPLSLEREDFPLRGVLDDLVALLRPEAEQRNVRMSTQCAADLLVRGDRERMSEVVLNLLRNGIDAIEGAGEIRLSAEREGDAFRISVEDDGIGMTEETRGRIFDLYFTTKDDGEGIGLSRVRRIVTAHGGRIRVTSQPGRGTRFDLHFPMEGAPAEAPREEGLE